MGVSVYHREPIEEEFLIPDVAQAKLHRGIWPIYAEALNVSRLKSYHRYLYDNSTNILILFGKTISYQMCCFNSIFNLQFSIFLQDLPYFMIIFSISMRYVFQDLT